MTRTLLEHLTLRARVFATVREFFATRAYLEVETPALVPSPGLDLHLDAFAVTTPEGRHAGYLITSPEYQMKRLLCAGLPRTFQFARCFRAGEIGRRHNPEFTMLEWYRAGSGYEELMSETEALVRQVANVHRDGVLWAGHDIDLREPFERLTVAQAFERFAGIPRDGMLDLARSDEDAYFRVLVDQVEPGIGSLGRPLFLHDYPATQASLARKKPNEPEVCERFELYVGDIELCNGFGELCDPVEQRARFLDDQEARRRQGKPVYPIDERFLEALESGMPDASGNALGLDRLIACVAGTDSIDEVMAFPHGRL
jgi:lysyl-tRNA synthetase class 2